jgi:two-component sensor histidine kinase
VRNVPGVTIGSAEGGTIGNNINLNGFNARTDIYLDAMRDRVEQLLHAEPVARMLTDVAHRGGDLRVVHRQHVGRLPRHQAHRRHTSFASVFVYPEVDESIEVAAYYVVAEAITNVGKYAHASSATVSISRSDGAATVSVADDGVGGADPTRGSGLRGLAARVEALNGHLDVDSAPGRGTRIRAEIPCPET